MFTHKHCPKCRGNMYTSVDYYGSYEECLQCGYIYDTNSPDAKKQPVALAEED